MDLLDWLAAPGIRLGPLISEGWSAYRGASQWEEVPGAEPSWKLALGAVLDRSFTAVTSVLTGVPTPEAVRKLNGEAAALRDFFDERGWIREPAGYYPAPPPVEEWSSAEESTWSGSCRQPYEHVSWISEYHPHPGEPGGEQWLAREENRMSHAYVLEHPGGPRPWLVCVHGFAMGTPLINFNGFAAKRLHEDLGLNLIFPCLPLHGPRGGGMLSGIELIDTDFVNLVHAFAHAVWDIRRTLSWVRKRQPKAVGLYGISLGGYLSALTASIDTQLDCVIASIPMVDLASAAHDNEPWIFRTYEREFEIDWAAFRAITRVVSPLSLEPRVARERRFICAGTADRVVRPNHARALWRHWERPEIYWFPSGHVLGMMHPSVPDFVERCVRSAGMA
ncbi:MAG: alpha/beta hydrolase [Deltaproteobacteria bacterium]|nr:alpha/beta hydrolase [Deltaproteobacteria bacterium]